MDSFVCSNTFESVIANFNDKLYVRWSQEVERILTLDAGDLASHTDLASLLTLGLAALSPSMPAVTVTAVKNE